MPVPCHENVMEFPWLSQLINNWYKLLWFIDSHASSAEVILHINDDQGRFHHLLFWFLCLIAFATLGLLINLFLAFIAFAGFSSLLLGRLLWIYLKISLIFCFANLLWQICCALWFLHFFRRLRFIFFIAALTWRISLFYLLNCLSVDLVIHLFRLRLLNWWLKIHLIIFWINLNSWF